MTRLETPRKTRLPAGLEISETEAWKHNGSRLRLAVHRKKCFGCYGRLVRWQGLRGSEVKDVRAKKLKHNIHVRSITRSFHHGRTRTSIRVKESMSRICIGSLPSRCVASSFLTRARLESDPARLVKISNVLPSRYSGPLDDREARLYT